jgi:beta-lactamase regulating signal transducer with metallopeptidase domain/uncharacterized GH25 family protein
MNALLMASRGLQPIVDAPVWIVLLSKITAILLIAWLIHLALARTNPRWRVFLWRVTTVGLIVLPAAGWLLPALEIHVLQPPPVVETAAVSAAPQALSPDRVAPGYAPAASTIKLSGTKAANILPISANKQPETMSSSALPQPRTHATVTAKSAHIAWLVLPMAAWLGGIAVLGFRLCLGHYRISTIARRAAPATEMVRHECMRVAGAIGCRRRVDVLQSTEVDSPFLCGLRRPLLLLPARMSEDSYRNDLPGILAHELTHVRSHDVPWNTGLQLISILLWFHPLVWHMRKAHLAACELVCDASSASFVGDVAEYCRTLARVAVDVIASQPAAGIAMARLSTISRRLIALKKRVFDKPLRRRRVLAFGIAGLLAVAALGIIQFAAAALPDDGTVSAVDKNDSKNTATHLDTTLPKSELVQEEQPEIALKIAVHAEDAGTGKPLADVPIVARAFRISTRKTDKDSQKTDAEGNVTFEISGDLAKIGNLSIEARPAAYVPQYYHWTLSKTSTSVPGQITMSFKKGIIIGGQIQDTSGKPIVDAKVELSMLATLADNSTHFNLGTLKSDKAGHWQCDVAPEDLSGVRISASHPNNIRAGTEATLAMKEQKHVLILEQGAMVRGQVLDPQGQPVQGVNVSMGRMWLDPNDPRAKTDAKGQFVLKNCPLGQSAVTVQGESFAPQCQQVTVAKENPPLSFNLEPGAMLRGRVVDQQGKPMEGVDVYADTWQDIRTLNFRTTTDKEGRFIWKNAPRDAVTFDFLASGFKSDRDRLLKASDEEQTITLYPELLVRGTVVDEETGKPIDKFQYCDGFRRDTEQESFFSNQFIAGEKGRFEYHMQDASMPNNYVKVVAEGYNPAISRAFKPTEGQQSFEFKLKKGKSLGGIVLLPDGKPAQNATVALVSKSSRPLIENGALSPNSSAIKAITDAEGRFSFIPQSDFYSFIALHQSGFADITQYELGKAGSVKLKPWGHLEGVVKIGNQLAKNVEVTYQPNRFAVDHADTFSYTTNTDNDGHFIFDRVLPGKGNVARVVILDLGDMSAHAPTNLTSVEIFSEKTAKVEIGGKGRPVVGRIDSGGKITNWTDVGSIRPNYSSPGEFNNHHSFIVESNGSFRIEDVVAGEYVLDLQITDPHFQRMGANAPPGSDKPLGIVTYEFSVPEMSEGHSNKPLDIGTIKATFNQPPKP